MAFSDYFNVIHKLKLYEDSYNTVLSSGHSRAAGHMNSQWLGQHAQNLGISSQQIPARRKEIGTQSHPQSWCCEQCSLGVKQTPSAYLRLMQTEQVLLKNICISMYTSAYNNI